jgi:heme/copper-type cytochrome/quinol oxidase subunit 3
MSGHNAIDVSPLPTFAFGNRSILWWATMGMIAIEGAGFALLGAAYLYLRWREPNWPPGLEPPDLIWGTSNTALLLASGIPNELTKRAAERLDLGKVRFWISVCLLLSIGFFVLRWLEFTTLNCWWDTNAYGSIVWFLLGMHTTHIVTDFADTAVLAAIMFAGPVDGNRFVDISENSLYWYFVVGVWLPVYGLIYIAPRLL